MIIQLEIWCKRQLGGAPLCFNEAELGWVGRLVVSRVALNLCPISRLVARDWAISSTSDEEKPSGTDEPSQRAR